MRGCIIRYFPPQVWWWRRRRRRILARRMVEMWQANRQGGSMGSRPPGCGAKVRGKYLINQPLIQVLLQLSV